MSRSTVRTEHSNSPANAAAVIRPRRRNSSINDNSRSARIRQ